MPKVRRILCVCACGLGTSVLWEMNTKKALEILGVNNIIVKHSSLKDVYPDEADLYVCSEDLVDQVSEIGEAVGIENMMLVDEYVDKLRGYFE